MNDDNVASRLRRLPEPAPPPAFSRAVMARVRREAEEHTRGLTSGAMARARQRQPVGWRSVFPWAVALGGITIVFVSWMGGRLVVGSSGDPISWVFGTLAFGPPRDEAAVPGVALGLLLFMAGMFAPLRARR